MKPGRIMAFVVGAAILAYLFSKIEFIKIKEAALSLNPVYVLGFFIILTITVILKGLKWRMSLGLFGIRTSIVSAIETWLIGFSVGAATPGRVGDFVKIAYLDEKKSKSIGAVFLDRITDVFAVLFFAFIGFAAFGEPFGVTKPLVALAAAAIIACAVIAKKYYRRISGVLLRHFVPEKYRTYLKSGASDFIESARSALKLKARIIFVLILSALIWMFSVIQALMIAKSLEISISYFSLLFIMSVVALVELIPVTVAGLGTREATIVFLMSFIGIESEKAIVFSLLNFFFGYFVLASAGYLFWVRNPIKIR
ncbi:MAG: lysylphosphatidylglycerol synthase transmembrane domain-containing protein [Nanoarchaeota archaeon]|nr:flippase-like domain-containing protein [Nanoarchaeota archaeon]MCG2724052.1 flippase-like domain-containing protein [archaeon]